MEFMSEFARYLVAAGITSSRFVDIAQMAFYRAASHDARFRNKRLNQSAVAAMTGLSRVQVRGLSKREETTPRVKTDRIDKIIEGWVFDPVFITSNFAPKRLSVGNRNATFNALVRKYGGDVPARSVLRELVRTGCVTVKNRMVSLNAKARRTVGQTRLQYLSRSLAELLRESGKQSDSVRPLRAINGEVVYQATSAKGRILMQKRMARSLDALMADLKTAGAAASVESPPDTHQSEWLTRTRIVVISEELNSENEI